MPASPRTARLINDRAAVDLLLERGPLTRSQLRDLTGLSGPTVSDLVARLEQTGLVRAFGAAAERRRGPNARLYGIVADHAYAVGVDVSGDGVVAAAVDLTGTVVNSARADLHQTAPPHEQILAVVRAALPEGADLQRLTAVVVGTPGLVDPETGDVGFVARLPNWRARVRGGLQAAVTARIVLENEVNLAGVAEQRIGSARGRESFALLSFGEGIGVAVVLGGQVHRGASGGAGEAGYLPVGAHLLQDIAGGAALVDLARSGGHGRPETVWDLAGLLDAGDPALLSAVADRIAPGAAAVGALLDPGLLVLGGEIGRSGGARLAACVQDRLTERIPQRTEVVAATAPGNPVLQGAHLVGLDLAREAVLDD